MSDHRSGGFLPQVIPSPSPSAASTVTPGELPRPREHPLRPGSQKEIAFVSFVDSKMLNISRRYAKKFSSDPKSKLGPGKGYDSFKEVVQDLEAIFDVVWVSGTRTCLLGLELRALQSDFPLTFILRWPHCVHLVSVKH